MPFQPITEEEFGKKGSSKKFKPIENADEFEGPPTAGPAVDEWQSRKIGALQGGTFGFADELEAALRSGFGDEKYRDVWKELQKEIEEAQRNKGAYFQGELAGGVASSFIPGLGLGGNVLRGAKTLNAARSALPLLARMKDAAAVGAKLGAIQGGLSGLGSGGELRLGTVGDIGLGAAGGALAGGATGAFMEPVSDLIRPAVIMAKEKVAKPFMRAVAPLFKVNQRVAAEVTREPHIYQGAPRTIEEIGLDATSKLNQFSDLATADKAQALSQLTDAPAIPAKEVLKILSDAGKETKATYISKIKKTVQTEAGPQEVIKKKAASKVPGALETMKSQRQYVKSLADDNGMISEKNLREVIESFDLESNWDALTQPVKVKPIADAFKKARGVLNQKLKEINQGYAAPIEEASKKTGLVKEAADALQVKPTGFTLDDEAGRYATTDATLGMLRNIRNKEISAKTLDELAGKFPETEFAGAARRARNEIALGLQNPSFGAIIGGASGNIPLALIGGGRDVMGPGLWRRMTLGIADPTTEGTFENFLRRSLVTPAAATAQGAINPYQPQTEFEFPEEEITPRKK